MATGATPNLALPYPVPTDPNNVPADVQALATAIEGVFIPQGLFANRPAAGKKGAWWFSTDKEWVSRDDGTAWHDFQSKADADAAYTVRAEIQAATVATSESTASTGYGALTTAGPSVTVKIGASGTALITLSAQLGNDTAGGYALMSVGGPGLAVADGHANYLCAATTSAVKDRSQQSYTFLATGLTPGATQTFTCQYRAFSAGTAWFANRSLVVDPR